MKHYNVVILGGGASGSIAAIKASERYDKVAVIDKANKIAKKILVTGNGRCNLSNINVCDEKYNKSIQSFLSKFGVKETLDFFKSLGLVTYTDEEGRVYPVTNSAKSVLEVIENKIKKQNVDCYFENKIIQVEKWDNRFLIKTDKDELLCKKVIIALGGNSSIKILDLFPLSFVPSLVSLRCNISRNLSGCRISNVKVTGENSKGETKTEFGEVLFREKGLSGICIFNISTIFARTKDFSGKLSIDIFPNLSKKELFDMLKERKALDEKINYFFDGLLIKQVGYEVLNRLKLDENRSTLTLSDKEIESMVEIIKNLEFKVTGCLDNNQVFSGGIDLKKLTENLEHKDIKGLYFCGEACDVDGECGGFNLQWAWTSGYIVGENV